jgi:gliding motility-associated-like protein
MKALVFLFTVILYNIGFSQTYPPVALCLGLDASVCQGQSVILSNCTGLSAITNTLGTIYLNAPTTVPLTDDNWSSTIPIGFSFSFYGTSYSNCVIGSNGLISFNTSNAGAYCPYSLSTVGSLPNSTFASALNSIMLCYQDINPSTVVSPLGGIEYQTIGTAPNRKFIVLYRDINFFNCTGVCNYMAVILNEGTNAIELHIGNKPTCNVWNGGLAIQGIQNSTGSDAVITPGRNNTIWSANQDGKKFTPASPSNTSTYTQTTIPYVQVSSLGSSLQWHNTLGQSFPYNNGTLNITTLPSGSTGFFVTGSACGASLGTVSDTTWLTRLNISVTASSTTDYCGSGVGTVSATPGQGTPPFTYSWTPSGATTQSLSNVVAGNYSVTMTDSNGCHATATKAVTNTTATYTAVSTLVSCPGGNNGTATATITPSLGTITYLWDDPLAQTTKTATNLSAGVYHCTISSTSGCVGIATVTVGTIPPMIATIVKRSNVTCNSGNNGILQVAVTQGTSPYAYSWNHSASILDSANDLAVGSHTVTITDAKGCVINVTDSLSQPMRLKITSITPPTKICPEAKITLAVTGTGGSSPYTFTWSESGTVIGTGTSIIVDPSVTNTTYCVKLSETCGSPVTDSCTIISFPVPIEPSVSPDKSEKCTPASFYFTNNSTNSNEIATTYYQFTDGYGVLKQGADTVSNTFKVPSQYSVTMTVTSIYGCVYTSTFDNIVVVRNVPKADFTFSSNPSTFLETNILLQNRSSVDVVSWDWVSLGSSPAYSTLQNPVFRFPEGEVGVYPVSLVVTSNYGCVDSITYLMHVISDILFYAPNSFTPNGDELNQSWGVSVSGIDIYTFNLQIFNRWGELVWESHDISQKWDGTYNGKLAMPGTYIWKASAKSSINDGKRQFSGYLNILK